MTDTMVMEAVKGIEKQESNSPSEEVESKDTILIKITDDIIDTNKIPLASYGDLIQARYYENREPEEGELVILMENTMEMHLGYIYPEKNGCRFSYADIKHSGKEEIYFLKDLYRIYYVQHVLFNTVLGRIDVDAKEIREW